MLSAIERFHCILVLTRTVNDCCVNAESHRNKSLPSGKYILKSCNEALEPHS